jgi:xylan 1,4-beta-xylosidase
MHAETLRSEGFSADRPAAAAPTLKFSNPVIRGFNPDPSVCRVGDDFYLVTSSFEFFPGVPIYHSRDLIHWNLIGNCLTRPSQLPLERADDSGGIYAPTIRHHNGRYYMTTTNVSHGGNFIVWASQPAGPWSDPIWIEQKGIDPSLWFDDDGKVYFTSNGTRWAPERGIYQCEIDITTGARLSETRLIWRGTGGSYPEAPHLFRRGGYYYLVIAEGGTEACHMVTIARSHHPYGPFEPCPRNPILSNRSLESPIQNTGHADLFTDQHGRWWAVFLAVRPHQGVHHLGRETCLAAVEWDSEAWPIINGGQRITLVGEGPVPMAADAGRPRLGSPATVDGFGGNELAPDWVHLRTPALQNYQLKSDVLTLRPAVHNLNVTGSPTAIFRRQLEFELDMSVVIDFVPLQRGQEAGVAIYRSTRHYAQLCVTSHGHGRQILFRRRIGSMVEERLADLPAGPILLAVTADQGGYTFSWGNGGLAPGRRELAVIGGHESRYLSSEVAGGYIGVMPGLYAAAATEACADGELPVARFSQFQYRCGAGNPATATEPKADAKDG